MESSENSPKTLKEIIRAARRKIETSAGPATLSDNSVVDIYATAENSKSIIRGKTGVVYDDQFKNHKCEWDSNFPENPERYKCIIRRMMEYGLLDRCQKIPGRLITDEEIKMIHEPGLIKLLKLTRDITDLEILEVLSTRFDSIYFNNDTYKTALWAAGSGLNLVSAICNGQIQNGMAIIRPPGHHAAKNEFNGYCFFNNVALAAQMAIEKFNKKKILIVDWDVHHGQGTQRIFYDNPKVLYFSTHRYEHGSFWPNLDDSDCEFVGEDDGEGYNINVPLNELGCSDSDFIYIFLNVLLPVALEYQPDLVLVSAGYDAAIGCPEGRMYVTPLCYASLTNMLMSLANGQVAVFLEGGYYPESLSEGAAITLGTLLGDSPPKPKIGSVFDKVKQAVYKSISVLRNYWTCFSHFDLVDKYKPEDHSEYVKPYYLQSEYRECIPFMPPYPTRVYYDTNSPQVIQEVNNILKALKIQNYKELHNKVGYYYDSNMLLHKSENPGCYERPERLTVTMNLLKEFSLLDRMEEIKLEQLNDFWYQIHPKEYIKKLIVDEYKSEGDLLKEESWNSVYLCEHSRKSAQYAAEGLVNLVQNVYNNKLTSGIAIIRPPGHHADRRSTGGFCLMNNVAMAASSLRLENPTKIMILDWDIHHGNGTQNIFYGSENVLYLSIHRYENASFYPKSEEGNYNYVGRSDGKYFNINVAFNDDVMEDIDYMAAFTRIVLPVAYEYRPDIILVSAGFDAVIGDPLGGYKVSPELFAYFVHLLKPACNGKIVLALEGGYNCNSVAYSIAMCCKALLGDPLPPLTPYGRPSAGALEAIEKTISEHHSYWKLLQNELIIVEKR